MENVGSDLGAPAGDGVGAFDSGHFLLAFFLFEFPKLRLEQLEGDLAILLLITLALGFDDKAGRKVADTDGGADLVHILAAGAGRTTSHKLEVLVTDDCFN